MATPVDPREVRKNHLLSELPEDSFERILPHLQAVKLPLGKVLYESGDMLDYVYFPTTAIGIALFMGGNTTPNRAIIQSAGIGYKMKAKDLMDEFTRGGKFHDMLLRYTQALITQISQTAVCNRLHSVEEQLCRWLLLSHDRLESDKLVMTHDLISNMLGVRREGITMAARKLVKRNLIKNVRGTMTILDREGLEQACCECYEVVNTEYNRLLGRGMARTFA